MFCKTFKSKRYEQIVIMHSHADDGEPQLRFYFKSPTHGICEFSIGFDKSGDIENKMHQAFDVITPQDATEIIDGWMEYMQSSKDLH